MIITVAYSENETSNAHTVGFYEPNGDNGFRRVVEAIILLGDLDRITSVEIKPDH